MSLLVLLFSSISIALALPIEDHANKIGPHEKYEYAQDTNGIPNVLNPGIKIFNDGARFNPDRDNEYHLFTRQNPTQSQPLVFDENGIYGETYFNPDRRTVVIIHGWVTTVTADVNTVLTPAFLEAEDVNVIAIDWSAGAMTINYLQAVRNVIPAGESVARFLTKLNEFTGANPANYHILGFSLGGHMAGVIGRNMDGKIAYITALDPAGPAWGNNNDRFRSSDGVYTEVIHTNVGGSGYLTPLGHVDFYPNGGDNMPGCNSGGCNHDRAFYYLAESISSGGFSGRRCDSHEAALIGDCDLEYTLPLGGLIPKTGSSGVYYLETNASPPFSKQ